MSDSSRSQIHIRIDADLRDRIESAREPGDTITSVVIAALERHLATNGRIVDALIQAVDDAWWLSSTDEPALRVALDQARAIDHATPDLFGGVPADSSTGATYDRDVLIRMLDGLGFSPKGRRDLSIEEPERSDPIAAIIALAE